ncbi:MAG: hypothetical protein K9L17_10110 [Clostridiales bacterium]|nr:hypothetical protein [Clostridiales bacterium]MCF8023034.1 hypothetical protein [Clostridiales bacterium]
MTLIAGTFVDIINLWMAVFTDTGASMIVIANGMRLMRDNSSWRKIVWEVGA